MIIFLLLCYFISKTARHIVQFIFILQISILKLSRIPKIEKFRGDSGADFKIWITQFEGHLRALEIENDKRLDILFCCVEGTACPDLCNLRTPNDSITYAKVKDEFKQRFCRDQ